MPPSPGQMSFLSHCSNERVILSVKSRNFYPGYAPCETLHGELLFGSSTLLDLLTNYHLSPIWFSPDVFVLEFNSQPV